MNRSLYFFVIFVDIAKTKHVWLYGVVYVLSLDENNTCNAYVIANCAAVSQIGGAFVK